MSRKPTPPPYRCDFFNKGEINNFYPVSNIKKSVLFQERKILESYARQGNYVYALNRLLAYKN